MGTNKHYKGIRHHSDSFCLFESIRSFPRFCRVFRCSLGPRVSARASLSSLSSKLQLNSWPSRNSQSRWKFLEIPSIGILLMCPTFEKVYSDVQRASITAGLQPLRKALTTRPSALSPASSQAIETATQGQQWQNPWRNHPDWNSDVHKYYMILHITMSYLINSY